MSTTYEIKRVHDGPKEWESKKFKKRYLNYSLDLAAEDGSLEAGVESNRQLKDDGSHNEPRAGETVMGDINDGKLTLDYDAMKDLDGSTRPTREASTSGKAKPWTPEQERDPERSARILRQHSQGLAVQVLIAMGDFKDVQAQEHAIEIYSQLRAWTDHFDQDVIEAGQKAVAGQDGALPKQQDTPPPVEEKPAQQQPPADDSHQYLSNLLETAGLSSYPASKLADYVLGREPKVIAKAEHGLQDFDTQGKTLAGLKAAFERDEGEPVPSGPSGPMSGDDDIPFARPEYRPPFCERERWRR